VCLFFYVLLCVCVCVWQGHLLLKISERQSRRGVAVKIACKARNFDLKRSCNLVSVACFVNEDVDVCMSHVRG